MAEKRAAQAGSITPHTLVRRQPQWQSLASLAANAAARASRKLTGLATTEPQTATDHEREEKQLQRQQLEAAARQGNLDVDALGQASSLPTLLVLLQVPSARKAACRCLCRIAATEAEHEGVAQQAEAVASELSALLASEDVGARRCGVQCVAGVMHIEAVRVWLHHGGEVERVLGLSKLVEPQPAHPLEPPDTSARLQPGLDGALEHLSGALVRRHQTGLLTSLKPSPTKAKVRPTGAFPYNP